MNINEVEETQGRFCLPNLYIFTNKIYTQPLEIIVASSFIVGAYLVSITLNVPINLGS